MIDELNSMLIQVLILYSNEDIPANNKYTARRKLERSRVADVARKYGFTYELLKYMFEDHD